MSIEAMKIEDLHFPENEGEKKDTFERIPEEKGKLRVVENNERSIDENELKEALEWNELFNKGWVTAHELATLRKDSHPKKEGELFVAETKDLLKIKFFLDKNLSDEEFVDSLEEIEQLLPRPFQHMEGMQQSSPHGEFSPTEHTINALRLLNTENLNEEDRFIARMSLVFHDVGKVEDPRSRVHSYRSEKITKDYLEKMDVNEEVRKEILAQIRYHDALGEAARRDGDNMFDHRDVLLLFPTQRQLDIHRQIAMADIGSIPYLEWALSDIEKTYREMSQKMEQRDHWINVEKFDLPFEEVENDVLFEIREELFEEDVHFDNVYVEEDIKYRRAKFEGGVYNGKRFRYYTPEKSEFEFKGVSQEQKEKLEKLIVQYAFRNDRKLLFALKVAGRETDLDYLRELEDKYEMKIPNLEIAINMHKMTYRFWELNYEVQDVIEDDPEDIERVEKKLIEIKKAAEVLSNYTVEVTHGTSIEAAYEIEEGLEIGASDSRYEDHFEGDGVYTGMFKTYRDWGERIFKMRVSLADSFPIILDYRYPKAMANILSEYVKIVPDEKEEILAFPKGLTHWRQGGFGSEEVTKWKLSLLQKMLNSEVKLAIDGDDEKCVIADTDDDPIVWGSLCRALRIRRFIPFEELKKFDLDSIDIKKGENIDEIEPIEMKHYDRYSGLARTALRIKGIRREDLE